MSSQCVVSSLSWLIIGLTMYFNKIYAKFRRYDYYFYEVFLPPVLHGEFLDPHILQVERVRSDVNQPYYHIHQFRHYRVALYLIC